MLRSEANAGPSTEPSDTVRPPASTTAMVCAAASLPAPPAGEACAAAGRSAGSCRGRGRCRRRPRSRPPTSRRTASARWRTETAGRVRLVTSFAPIMISATSGCSASALSTCASSSRGLRAGDGQPDQPDRALGQLGERGGDQHAGGLGGPLDAQADGAGVAEDGEHERLAAAAGRRCRRPRAGRPSTSRASTLRRAARASSRSSATSAAPARPTLPPPYAAPVASRRAVAARVTRPSAPRRSSPCAVPAHARLSALYGSICGPLTRRCDPVHRTGRTQAG